MPKLTISSEHLRADILSSLGARVTSLAVCSPDTPSGQRELLWTQPYEVSGDSAWQHGGLPLLFPFAGRVWDEGELGFYRPSPAQRFALPLHGFAHYLPWKVEASEASEAVLSLEDNEHTRSLYPWSFKLVLRWRLEGRKLIAELTSSNRGCLLIGAKDLALPLAAGFHPYFALPTEQGTAGARLSSGPCQVQAVTEAGAAGELLYAAEERRAQNLAVIKTASLILRDFEKKPEVALQLGDEVSQFGDEASPLKIKGDEHTRCFVLWSDRKDAYFCAEPWMGLPDAVASGYGLQRVAHGASMTWRIVIQC